MKLADKVIVVTGGAGLLGREFCAAIATAGAKVVVADLDVAAAEQVVTGIKETGHHAEAAKFDITDQACIDSAIEQLHADHGRIDAVVNNAYPRNRNYGRKLEEVSYGDFCENTGLHLGGYFLVSQRFSLYFKEQGYGNIVNMSSIYGVIAPRFEVYENTSMTMPVEYSAIKAGVVHLSRYFAQYYKKEGVRCNALSPGGILDKQPDEFLESYKKFCGTKGMLESGDMTGTLLFLLSDDSKYVNGQNLVVDDGFSL